MKLFLKALAVIVAIPAIAMAGAFSYGMYLGFTEVAEYDDMVAEFEVYMEDLNYCAEIDNEDEFSANLSCLDVCDSFFECRSIALNAEWELAQASQELHEDTYTDEEYAERFGPVNLSEVIVDPGTAPQPVIN